jgi:hypothetical protein
MPQLNKLFSPADTASNPLTVTITFTQLPEGNWLTLLIASNGNRTETAFLSSAQYRPAWNTVPSEGIDAVRYFREPGRGYSRRAAGMEKYVGTTFLSTAPFAHPESVVTPRQRP